MLLGWVPVNGSSAVAVFFNFLSLELVSLLLPSCTWAGMVGEGIRGFVACACSYRGFCEDLWLWLPLCVGTGWVEELTCLFPVWRLLKEYTKFGEFG